MNAFGRLPDEALERLLDGSPSEEAPGTPLAAYLTELRDDARATTPVPSDELTAVLTEGLEPAELEAGSTPAAAGGLRTWQRRARSAARVLVAKVAALGMLGKAAAAGAAVTVAASGAGAAGVLPQAAQHAFDDAVGREVVEEPADGPDAGETPDDPTPGDETTDAGGTAPQTPADTSTTKPLDTDVSDDATGVDGERGVDGRDIADDASDGRRQDPQEDSEGPPGRSPEEPPGQSQEGPPGRSPEEPPGPATEQRPGEQEGRADDGQSETPQGQGAAANDPQGNPATTPESADGHAPGPTSHAGPDDPDE